MDPQQRHEAFIKAINKVHGGERFTIKKKQISPYDTATNSKYQGEIIGAAAVVAEIMNYTGGSVGQVDLYKLLGAYLTDDDKRQQINQIIKP